MAASPRISPRRKPKTSEIPPLAPAAAGEPVVQSASTPAADIPLDDPSLYINRELSLLEFQRRVLDEARDEGNPLLERVKFLSIVGSNLDEFFMVRVAGLKEQIAAGLHEVGPDGMPPEQQLEAIRGEVIRLMEESHRCLRESLLPALSERGIHVLNYAELDVRQRARADAYFEEVIFPVLTPLAFDPGRPFPHISNLSLNLAVLIRDGDREERFARVKVPDTLPQLVAVHDPRKKSEKVFVWIEQLIAANLSALFPGMEIIETHPFHVTRDADLEIQELEAGDLLESIEEGVRARRFQRVVRLKVNQEMPTHILEILVNNLEISWSDVYHVGGPLSLSRLKHLAAIDRPDLKDTPFVPPPPAAFEAMTGEDDIYAVIRRGDVLLHHPYYSFQPVVDFLNKAARDPNVLAIKMTLYRVGRQSPVVEALLDAQRYGKQVAVLVELKARFDEESNIEWARALEREGVHVVYGLVGLKIHAKAALVVRREGDRIRRYVHLATGNYNTVTAHLYTDLGLFTCDEQIGADVTDLFNYLTGYSAKSDYRKLLVAPINLRKRLRAMIEREIEQARAGRSAHLIFKTNALVDRQIIRLLYSASKAGVQVDLLVRGICCLRPGIPGISDRIRVISIVGRFLEHSRIYYFHNGGEEEVYIGSADLMPRNISRRVEVLTPVQDKRHVRHLRDKVLATYLADVRKARFLTASGSYVRPENYMREGALESQAWFVQRALKKG
jgi:polyphosphate kinase